VEKKILCIRYVDAYPYIHTSIYVCSSGKQIEKEKSFHYFQAQRRSKFHQGKKEAEQRERLLHPVDDLVARVLSERGSPIAAVHGGCPPAA
jgi:hypothetical protein